LWLLVRTHLFEDFFGAVDADSIFCDQLFGEMVDLLTQGAGCDSHLASMEGHVTALDTFRGQGAQGS
jgi:hypothetical protein